MKLNCDLGESFGSWKMGADSQVMPFIDQANIACGFHAGDPLTMQNTLQLAKQHNVSIGAHPSYPDLVGFGRRSMQCTPEEITALVTYQIAAIDGMAKSLQTCIEYVKPHGALYNDMMEDTDVRSAILTAISRYNLSLASSTSDSKALKLMLLATADLEHHRQQAKSFNVDILAEAFADRCYDDNGKLLSRDKKGAVLSKDKMLAQVKQLKDLGCATTINGNTIKLSVDSLCVHGDNTESINAIAEIKALICQ
ncbi:MAG: 5-oxoprolinase subunit PxpA [Colwellia sp.]|nr:5-oxoprolinase subunit PxpA [Colwellia sp.]